MSTSPHRRASLASRVWAREIVRPARRESGPKNLVRFVLFAACAIFWLLTGGSGPAPAFRHLLGAGWALCSLQALLIFAVQINDDVHIHRDRRRAAATPER